ncbi:hypothetical protein [Streptomyces sp. NPDC048641]|uniref:hypothetical protein n=1 Tax=unclassified Streptomyces TaxID=2593676 RepID=UPI0034139860
MTARADELVVLSRRGDEPMRVRARVLLGSGDIRHPENPALPGNPPPHRPSGPTRTGFGRPGRHATKS